MGKRPHGPAGDTLCALFASLGLAVDNTGRETIFFLNGNGSIVDVTQVSEATSGKICDGRVRTNCENVSDHHHIKFSYSVCGATSTSSATLGGRRAGRRRTGCHAARIDANLFAAAVVACEQTSAITPSPRNHILNPTMQKSKPNT